jgi:hypothetical protein
MYKFWLRGPLMEGEPGAGGGGGGTIDAKAIAAEISKGLAASLATAVSEAVKAALPKAEPPAGGDGSGSGEGGDPKNKGKEGDDPRFAQLERDLKKTRDELANERLEREKASKAAEESERHSLIRSALGGYEFGTEKARDTAFRIFRDEVVRGKDGKLYGPDAETPFGDYIKGQMEKEHEYLLRPRDVGGAGAQNGGSRRPTAFELEDIKPGMSKEVREAARQAIAAHLPQK